MIVTNVLIDQWEKAISLAPSVSHEYWQSLAKRYADHLESQDSSEAFDYYILSNQIEKVKYIITCFNF